VRVAQAQCGVARGDSDTSPLRYFPATLWLCLLFVIASFKEFRKDIPFKEFIREISLNCVIEHPNLVKSIGGVTKNGKMIIVQELMQANLADVLAEKSIQLDSGIILEVALQAAEGIWHLHSHCNLIHRYPFLSSIISLLFVKSTLIATLRVKIS
jgi:hypothetical protein